MFAVVYARIKATVGTNAAANVQTPGLGSATWRVAYSIVVADSADERELINVYIQFIYRY
jgi:hypothetical protein